MITCSECIERLSPDDPRVRSGRYRKCGCDYCSKPSYYREIEEEKEPGVVEHIRQLLAQVTYLNNKVDKLYEKKSVKLFNKYTY